MNNDVETKNTMSEADGYFGEGDLALDDSLNVDWLDEDTK